LSRQVVVERLDSDRSRRARRQVVVERLDSDHSINSWALKPLEPSSPSASLALFERSEWATTMAAWV